MIILPLDAKDEDVLQVVCSWVELLAQGKYDEAYSLLTYAPGEGWTPELIRILIANYGSLEPFADGRTFHVTSLHDNPTLPEGRLKPYKDVEWAEEREGSVGWVHFDLPLNGEFSDLTAVFKIVKADAGLALELYAIDVL